MRRLAFPLLLAAASILLGPGCSDDETTTATTGDPPEVCVDYGSVDVNACCDTAPDADGNCAGNAVPCSFSNHVIPLFQQSCNFSSCHQLNNNPQEGLALGLANGETMMQADIDQVHGAIVGGSSLRSSLAMVEAGDPAGSWLLAKLEYEDVANCAATAATCTGEGCGVLMPFNSPKMKDWQIAIVRAWIADGAKND